MAFYKEIQKTGSTPYVLVDEAKGYMKFEGESFHENVSEFFEDISEWLAGYLASDFSSLTFDCALSYFNSSTAKLLFNILLVMDEYALKGKDIAVNWITTEDNEIIIECGEDFMEDCENLTFNLVVSHSI